MLGIPAGALAVTGNLTVTGPSSGGYVALTVAKTAKPATSTINFPARDTRAIGVTVPLAADGSLAIVFASSSGAKVHAIFDVTGYFMKGSGATDAPLPPSRILDTRSAASPGGRLPGKTPRTFAVAGTSAEDCSRRDRQRYGHAPDEGRLRGSDHRADSRPGHVNDQLPCRRQPGQRGNDAAWSRRHAIRDLYARRGDRRPHIRCDWLLPGRGRRRRIRADYAGKAGRHSARAGHLGGSTSGAPKTASISGRYVLPRSATAITGNVTVTGQTSGGYVALTDAPTGNPSTSTINFPRNDTRANGILHAPG